LSLFGPIIRFSSGNYIKTLIYINNQQENDGKLAWIGWACKEENLLSSPEHETMTMFFVSFYP